MTEPITQGAPAAPSAPAGARRRRLILLLGIGVAAIAGASVFAGVRLLGTRSHGGVDSRSTTAADPAADEMNAGLHATDPSLAITHFQRALALVPSHYGASFQLARALDRAGRRDEAQPIWERVLRMAEGYDDRPVIDVARARLADPMKLGLDALYTKHDPGAAAAQFRAVLAQNPEHYGATFQLATALDQLGKPAESRPLWAKMLGMAAAIKDTATVDRARDRLAEIDKNANPDPDAETMRLGVEALRVKRDPVAAAALFRQVLAHNPDHYGATFQLATALDEAKKPAEARPLWVRALTMANAVNDVTLATTARARLAKNP